MIVRVVVNLVAITLATGGIVDYWKNGSIFATWRASLEARQAWWCELLSCSFCMNGQVPLWLTLFQLIPSLCVREPWCYLLMAPTYGMAAAYTAWLVNVCRGEAHGYDRAKILSAPPKTAAEIEVDLDRAAEAYNKGYTDATTKLIVDNQIR